MVQPVASAGATLQAIWLSGQFQGVMKPQTPIGSLTITVVPRSLLELEVFSTWIAVMKWPMPMAAWARCASQTGAPISSVIAFGHVLVALLVFGDDASEQLEALSRGWSARRSRRPCARP